jgi:hypothetical protein
MAEASSATTNHGDSAALVRKLFGLFTGQEHESHRVGKWGDGVKLAQSRQFSHHLSIMISEGNNRERE